MMFGPEDGEANVALREYVADLLGVRAGKVALQVRTRTKAPAVPSPHTNLPSLQRPTFHLVQSGAMSRDKVFRIDGVTVEEACIRIQAALPPKPAAAAAPMEAASAVRQRRGGEPAR